MSSALVFRHVPHEGLGTIEPFLNHLKVEIEYGNLWANRLIPRDPHPYDYIISMGGPMNVDETDRYPFLKEERNLISKAIHSGIPVLGICLGAQVIARALGARVYPGPQKEIGWYPIRFQDAAKQDPVFQAIHRPEANVFHWHGDTFDLPDGAVLLASSDRYKHQAFRFGDSVYAFQFHIEVTCAMIADWMSKGAAELDALGPSFSREALVQDSEKLAAPLGHLAESIYSRLFAPLGSGSSEKIYEAQ